MNKSVKEMMSKLRSSKKGQGMTEYIIIVALIAIAAIGVITVFGDNIRAQFGNAANALGGATGTTNTTQDSWQNSEKGMGNFADDNEGSL